MPAPLIIIPALAMSPSFITMLVGLAAILPQLLIKEAELFERWLSPDTPERLEQNAAHRQSEDAQRAITENRVIDLDISLQKVSDNLVATKDSASTAAAVTAHSINAARSVAITLSQTSQFLNEATERAQEVSRQVVESMPGFKQNTDDVLEELKATKGQLESVTEAFAQKESDFSKITNDIVVLQSTIKKMMDTITSLESKTATLASVNETQRQAIAKKTGTIKALKEETVRMHHSFSLFKQGAAVATTTELHQAQQQLNSLL